MGFKFLSDEWFAEVDKIREEAGDLEIPEQLADLKLNLVITEAPQGDAQMLMNGGNIEKGNDPDCATTLTVPYDLAKKLFIDGDNQAAMQGFMSGQIKVDGDMSKLMSMQTVQPSDKQQELQEKIRSMTEA
ncbi:MAG TPA: SCP-2 sterol transfer family protein [Gammaproteobacteria bacterium]|nr:SCP-2 sterol transfer family protein [Gammaproteobacteria bacterium]